jgi:hypothetical protein
MDSKWIFSLVNGATYFWANQIRNKLICNHCHKEAYVSKSHMVCLQQIEEHARLIGCNRDLFGNSTRAVYNAHEAMNSAYGFDLLY